MNDKKPNVIALTVMFFTLNFLTATQDIVVDGWAISMLKRFVISFAVNYSRKNTFLIFLFILRVKIQPKYRVKLTIFLVCKT